MFTFSFVGTVHSGSTIAVKRNQKKGGKTYRPEEKRPSFFWVIREPANLRNNPHAALTE